jgi:hypothetical protein
MSIPESQLETWCTPGATVTSSQAYASVRAALEHKDSPVAPLNPEIYLQGSYGNSTNIYAESDVDVVVQMNESWYQNLDTLPELQKQAYKASFGSSPYGAAEFRTDTLKALTTYYGSARVIDDPRAIKVTVPNGRRADVIPGFVFRKYQAFYSKELQFYTSGIQFADKSSNMIVNYPRIHIKNGEEKNKAERTKGRFKPTVRMFKNARSYLVNQGALAGDVAPSYFVECLIYNVPDHLFVANNQDTFAGIWDYIWGKIDPAKAVCQSEQIALFGTSRQQWTIANAALLFDALKELWNNW